MKRRIALLLAGLLFMSGCAPQIPSDDFNGSFAYNTTRLQRGCETEEGIYWDFSGVILYMDKNSQEAIVLCSRPGCNHSGKDCEARIGEFPGSDLCVNEYSGQIYYIYREDYIGAGRQIQIRYELRRMNPDGSEKQQVRRFTLPSGTVVSGMSVLHRGYLYCFGEEMVEIGEPGEPDYHLVDVYRFYRLPLTGGQKPELLWESDESSGRPQTLYACENRVFFRSAEGTATDYKPVIYAYDIDNKTLSKVNTALDTPVNGAAFKGNRFLYMTSGNGIYAVNCLTGEKERKLDLSDDTEHKKQITFLDSIWCMNYAKAARTEGQKAPDADEAWIYNTEGELVNTITLPYSREYTSYGWIGETEEFAVYAEMSVSAGKVRLYTFDTTHPAEAELVLKSEIAIAPPETQPEAE